MASGSLELIMKDWPLVLLVADGEPPAHAAERHFQEYRELLQRKQEYALVCDATTMRSADAKLRQGYADFLKTHAPAFRQYCKGVGFVFGGAAIRGAFTAISWFTDMPFPYTTCATRAEAVTWAKARLSSH
jgi:hypothetical protein